MDREQLDSSPLERRSLGWGAAAALALAACAACASAPPPAAQPHPSREPLRYVIHRGDELEIRAFKVPELNDRVVVRADGNISVALLDDVAAAGLTPAKLANQLTRDYAPRFRDYPEITIIVRNFAAENVYVGGEVDEPGLVPLRYRMTSLKAIIQAGGFLDTAQMTNVVVLRNVGGAPEMIELDAKRVLMGEETDLMLRPWDVVFVPKSKVARANLFIEQYIKRVLPFSLRGAVQYAWISGAN
jgi:protein involved in polysaccharide export with SLBB domain